MSYVLKVNTSLRHKIHINKASTMILTNISLTKTCSSKV